MAGPRLLIPLINWLVANDSPVWFVKLVTDPITDIRAYYRSLARPNQN